MAATSDVVIIGGGVAGCSVAYFLAQMDIKSIIVENREIGSQASGYSAGGLNPLQGEGMPGPLAAFALHSFDLNMNLWSKLHDESGIDFHPRFVEVIKLAFDQSEIPHLKEAFDIYDTSAGFSAQWIEHADLYDLEPRLSKEILRGLCTYGNTVLDSHLYTKALFQAANKRGSSLITGEVTGLQKKGGRITGVTLNTETLSCDSIVLANGPWSSIGSEWLSTSIPVKPLKGEILRMKPPIGGIPSHDFTSTEASLFCRADGLLWVGATEEWKGFDDQPSIHARRTLLDGAIRMLPTLSESVIVKQTACLRPVTPDWLPILGKVPGWQNAYLATGAGKKGILMSAGMGKAIADIITTGSTELPIEPLNPMRFSTNIY